MKVLDTQNINLVSGGAVIRPLIEPDNILDVTKLPTSIIDTLLGTIKILKDGISQVQGEHLVC